MANATFDIQVTGTRDLKRATDNMISLGTVSRKLVSDYDALGASEIRRISVVRQLNSTISALDKALEDGRITQSRYNRAVEQAERNAQAQILTDKELIRQEKANRAELERKEKALQKVKDEAHRARMSYDQLYAAETRLKKAQEAINLAVKTGGMDQDLARKRIEDLTRDYNLWVQAVKSGNYEMINSGNSFARFNDEVFRTQQRLKRFASVGLQQAGYQVGDFIVQVQSGQSALVAFGQQASQLAGIFGAYGAVIGAGIAAFTGILLVLQSLDTEAQAAKKSAEEVDNAMQNLLATLRAYRDEKEAMSKGITLNELIAGRGLSGAQAEVKRLQDEVNRLTKLGIGATDDSSNPEDMSGVETEQLKAAKAKLQEALNVLRETQIMEYNKAADERAQRDKETLEAAERTRATNTANLVQSLKYESQLLHDKYKADIDALNNATDEELAVLGGRVAARLKIEEGYSAALEALNEKDRAAAAAQDAQRLKAVEGLLGQLTTETQQLEQWKAKQIEIIALASEAELAIVGGKYGALLALQAEYEARMAEILDKDKPNRPGVTVEDPLIAKLQQLQDSLLLEEEAIIKSYERKQEILKEALQKEYLIQKEYDDLRIELERRKNKELEALEIAVQQTKVDAVLGGLSAVLNAAANGNERLLKAARVASAAQALVNTYLGASQVLADPLTPWWVKFGAASGIVATGLGFVNAIKSGSPSGSSGAGSSASSVSVPATASPAKPQRVFIEGLDRSSLISGEQLSNIFEALYKENEDRGFVFEVAR